MFKLFGNQRRGRHVKAKSRHFKTVKPLFAPSGRMSVTSMAMGMPKI